MFCFSAVRRESEGSSLTLAGFKIKRREQNKSKRLV
uniref:Uncharacterized protein n=1 Tax=Anguilla anguilla TaxID=7936 RepID=A0A0E9TM56_ANGAN